MFSLTLTVSVLLIGASADHLAAGKHMGFGGEQAWTCSVT